MNKYIVTLLPYGDKMLPYEITVTSNTSDDAIIRAKRFVAENGYWPRHLNIEEIMECLEVSNITISATNITSSF